MRISHQWLLEFADFSQVVPAPEQMGRALTDLGFALDEILECEGDTVYELDITTNRPDCMNHLGVARELAARFQLPLRRPDCNLPAAAGESLPASVQIEDPALCPRYAARVLRGVRIGDSPEWLQRRLRALDQRPINNVVDATNLVMLEMGHPMHAFDYDLLEEGRIVVRRPRPGEDRLETLDGVLRTLTEDTLLICDGRRPVALAGVMGGSESEVSAGTVNLLLESAYFAPTSIRSTGKRLGLSTEASYRFERGADREAPVNALNRCCRLILELAGGESGPLMDEYPGRIPPVRIDLGRDRIRQVIGQDLSPAFVARTLESLEYQLSPLDSGWRVQVPTFRVDCSHPDDLVEDLLRHHGYDNVPVTYPPPLTPGRRLPCQAGIDRVIQTLLGAGYSEAVTLAFTTPELERPFDTGEGGQIAVGNPLSEEMSHLRSNLAAGLVASVRRNFNFGSRDVRLFEMGEVFVSEPQPAEYLQLGLVATGGAQPPFWGQEPSEFNFFHLKGVIEEVASGLGTEFRFEPWQVDFLQNGICAAILGPSGERIGWAGRLSPALEEDYKLSQPLFMAELSLDRFLAGSRSEPRFEELDRFPSSDRDLSFLVDNGVQFGKMEGAIKALNIPELRDIQPIDFYHGPKLPAGRKSLTIRLTFADPEKTLRQDEIAAHASAVIERLRELFDAELRS